VRLRRAVKDGSTPPKNLTVKEKNEERARNSPFVNHMPKKKKEYYLFTIGSVREPDDPYLLMEMSLTSQLSKIVSPIKVNQSSRNLHLPKERKKFQEIINKQSGSSNQHVLPKIDIPGASPSKSSFNAPRMHIDTGDYGDMLWDNLGEYNAPRPIIPNSHTPSTHTLAAYPCATPNSAISDLSDRDTMTPLHTGRGLSHASGGGGSGIYGDFEDDLVSGSSVNEDEYIEDIL